MRWVQIRVSAASAAAAEWAAAEAFAAGARGLEERSGGGDGSGIVELFVYAPAAAAEGVRGALVELAARGGGTALRVLGAELVPDEDWSRRWREGLGVVRVSARLAVRPPFVPDDALGPALAIEPGQAFGTGGHASTRLALAAIDALPPRWLAGARVVDAGTGSGVLALAALSLGARTAVGFDLDPVAAREARQNAERNGLAARAHFFAGPIAALCAAPFDLALANLLRSELLPILAPLAASLRRGGRAVLSGLLAGEREAIEGALAGAGLALEEAREERDPTGDVWLALTARR